MCIRFFDLFGMCYLKRLTFRPDMLQLDDFSSCFRSDHSTKSWLQLYLLQVFFSNMATAPQEMKVKTLEGEMLAVEVVPANTVKELRAMLLESKRCEHPIERQLLRVEVLTAGLLIDDDQTVESAGLLCAESDVTVVYARREVEAATKEGIHEGGPLGVIVPSHVTEIAYAAFQDCHQVLRVTVPESVKFIGENAFAGCGSLARVALPESLTIIEACAFADCTSLESVTIPESATSIGESAFAERNSLKNITILGSLTSISSYTFEACVSLTGIAIPVSVRVIEEFAFLRCFYLESVALPDSVEEIGESACEDCTSLINIHIPESATILGKRAFANWECLSEIKIPCCVGRFGDFAFENCYSLGSLLIDEGVPVIGFGAFRGCQSLTSILISASLRYDVEEAFDCDALENVTLFRKNGCDLIQMPFLRGSFAAPNSFTP